MDRTNANNANSTQFPPVVAVLGHVDHGKTSLLDAVRKTSIAAREFGGITQKIGASSVEIMHDGQKQRITFIDTPGHQAFSQMRSRGAQAADICLLIVSSVDGVMPQTKESIQVIQASKLPYIVVLTKSDLPTKNVEKAKQQLLQENVLLEGLGGDVPYIEISSKTNHNIQELLDLILLVQELHSRENVSSANQLQAIVIESKMDQRSGSRATIVVKDGLFNVRDELACEGTVFRVRNIVTDTGAQLKSATVGDAVEILGMSGILPVGSIVTDKSGAMPVKAPEQQQSLVKEMVYSNESKLNNLAIILVADTQGSLEAILASFPKEVIVISQKTGEVSEADVLLAKSTGAIVLSFNSKIRPEVQKLASTEKVLTRNYQIIYEMIDEIADVLEGKRLAQLEEIYGTARVLAKFPFEKTFAFGISVLEGRVARGDKVRVMRGDETIGESAIASVRIGKNPTSKVEERNEAGIVINGSLDIQVGDVLICHN